MVATTKNITDFIQKNYKSTIKNNLVCEDIYIDVNNNFCCDIKWDGCLKIYPQFIVKKLLARFDFDIVTCNTTWMFTKNSIKNWKY